MASEAGRERIVMTPIKKGVGFSVIRVEKVYEGGEKRGEVLHEGVGDNEGLVVTKGGQTETDEDMNEEQLSLEFKVFLSDVSKEEDFLTQESRRLTFRFHNDLPESDRMKAAHDFFKVLVSPQHFPRDYVGFITKVMKLLQSSTDITSITLTLTQSQERVQAVPHNDAPNLMSGDDVKRREEVTSERLLDLVERAYPNSISLDTLMRVVGADERKENEMKEMLEVMRRQRIIKQLENGSYLRAVHNEAEIHMVKQMPRVSIDQQPTIAVITSLYCEKLAVDAMLENTKTYVRYKTDGESNVYTVGECGQHKVVTTKLPAIGHDRSAMIAAGNTTTRLLGTFQGVEYVLVVGVGGGVPHYTDPSRHVRLGDVVVSSTTSSTDPIYMYLEGGDDNDDDESNDAKKRSKYTLRTWKPDLFTLQDIVGGIVNDSPSCWLHHMTAAEERLRDQQPSTPFNRPASSTDRLYMAVGSGGVIEVSHPSSSSSQRHDNDDGDAPQPHLHLGVVASGGRIIKDMMFRYEFAEEHGIKVFDGDFDAVVDSIYGNRKDSYMFIRGVSDYVDGQRGKEWSGYAALTAASFMKEVIERLPAIQPDGEEG